VGACGNPIVGSSPRSRAGRKDACHRRIFIKAKSIATASFRNSALLLLGDSEPISYFELVAAGRRSTAWFMAGGMVRAAPSSWLPMLNGR